MRQGLIAFEIAADVAPDPETTKRMHDETLPQDVFESAKFCSMRITQDIHATSRRRWRGCRWCRRRNVC